ncbi:MAG: hypothetical protein A2Y73_03295 [Chloroflexi bacterium RBG_13_56_8]|nr:MAG: hypothetical protein A2Y73_03295 [Chloroflexi bacterium RBG_13_56_8]
MEMEEEEPDSSNKHTALSAILGGIAGSCMALLLLFFFCCKLSNECGFFTSNTGLSRQICDPSTKSASLAEAEVTQ